MNAAHLHLVLNHLPVIGVALGTILLGIGIVRAARPLEQTGLMLLVAAGIAAGAAYWTGDAAEDVVEEASATSLEAYVEPHEEAALFALAAAAVVGLLSAATLVQGRKPREISKPLVRFTFAAGVIASLSLARVAYLGGQIAHPEIRNATSSVARQAGDDDER